LGESARRRAPGDAEHRPSTAEAAALVTVGMPVFNSERWIEDAIRALLAQTYRSFLLVISDNASTDATRANCERFAQEDERVQYHRNSRNVGLFKNYDRVFHLSSSKYFKWAAAGDICKPHLLERCVQVLEERPDVVLAYPRSGLFEERVELADPYDDRLNLQEERPSERLTNLLERIRLNNVINGVVRSDALRRTALNKPYVSSDINILAELALRGKFVEVPERLFFRRMSRATATAMKSEAENREYMTQGAADVYELRHWRMELGYFAGAWRSRLPFGEKLAVYRLLLRRLRYGRSKLLADLVAWFRNKISK
jgi:glycosyltransferase involved in cell wall biosynthesis